MDKLRACIVANYFANAGMTKVPEVSPHRSLLLNCCCGTWPTTAVLCVPACFQEWPGCSEPPSHPTVPGVTVTLLFSPQPGLRDPLPGPVGVGIPLAAGRWIWERRGVQRRRWQAGGQAWTQHGQSGSKRELIFFPFHPSDLSRKLYFDVIGHIWCAVISWSWAPSYVSHLWTWDLQALCKEDNRSGKRVQVCRSIDAIALLSANIKLCSDEIYF